MSKFRNARAPRLPATCLLRPPRGGAGRAIPKGMGGKATSFSPEPGGGERLRRRCQFEMQLSPRLYLRTKPGLRVAEIRTDGRTR